LAARTSALSRTAFGSGRTTCSIESASDGAGPALRRTLRNLDRDRVPALALRAIQRDVGAAQELVSRLAERKLRDAEARGHLVPAVRRRTERAERQPHPIGHRDGTLGLGAGQQDRELLAADPARYVDVTQVRPHQV